MSILSLIASDGFIVINKKILELFGIQAALLLGELANEANYWAMQNKLEDGFFRFELKCAEKNNLVIVTGYSDDLIELDGAIKQEGDCFNGENFHLEKYKDEWLLKKGYGCNSISAIWYDQNKTAENLEVIPWTYKTEIPHQSFFAKYRGETFCEGFVFSIEHLNMDNQETL